MNKITTMKLFYWMQQLSMSLSAFCYIAVAQAGIPVWSFKPNPNFPPQTIVSTFGTATVKYTVTNNSARSHLLVIKPQTAVTQNSPCILGPKGSANSTCTLTLTITGNEVPSDGLSGGPILCQANEDRTTPNPNQCYRPGKEDSLSIQAMMPCTQTSGNVPPISVNGNNLTIDSSKWVANCPVGYNVICKLNTGVTEALCINAATGTGNFTSLSGMGLTLLDLVAGNPFPGNIVPSSRLPLSCVPNPPIISYSFPNNKTNVCAACVSISPQIC